LKNKNEVHFCCNHGIGLGISKTHFTFVFVFGAVRTGYRPNKNKKRGIFHFCFCFLCPVSIGLSLAPIYKRLEMTIPMIMSLYLKMNHTHAAEYSYVREGENNIGRKASKGKRLVILHAITPEGPLCEVDEHGKPVDDLKRHATSDNTN
jgi:hypothetical protein